MVWLRRANHCKSNKCANTFSNSIGNASTNSIANAFADTFANTFTNARADAVAHPCGIGAFNHNGCHYANANT